MKAFRILGRNVRDSFKSVFRNLSLSLASISCITITLIVVAVAIVLSLNVNNFTKIVEKDVTIVAFLDVDITQSEIDDVYDEIIALDNVEVDNVEFMDKMKISEEMMESSEVFESIMSSWEREESPIQDTYQVKVTDITLINKTADQIKDIEHVDVVKYGEGMVEQLVSTFEILRTSAIVAVVALILVTAFLITNTIKITIMSRKREIEIMRLVGASNINIKLPFIFEGLILGFLGSIIPVFITMYGYSALYDKFDGRLFSDFLKLIEPTPFIYTVSLVLIAIGMIVGMFGSSKAVRKYLKI